MRDGRGIRGFWGVVAAVLVAFAVNVVHAGEADVLLSGMEGFVPAGQSAGSMGKVRRVDVSGQAFAQAVRAETTGSPANRWDVMLQARVSESIEQGDVLVARFWARTVDAMAAEAMIGLAVELNRDPWEKLAEGQYSVPREWVRIELPFIARKSFPARTVNANLRLGYAMQTLEIGGFELVRMPAGTKVESLARTVVSYRGMEAGAPWRKEAMERIERIRKADMRIVVRDRDGRRVPNSAVRVTLKRHAFAFGSAVDARLLLGDGEASTKYRQVVEESFNTVVYENDLKWVSLAADPSRHDLVQRTLPWFESRGIAVRGHVLVWPGLKWLPPAVQSLKDDPAKLREAIDAHVTELVTRYRGRLAEWDVLNEPFSNRDLENILGRDAFVEWFKLARAADPQARLFINDYGILETGNRLDTEHQRHYEEMIAYLLSQGAPVDGIGIQGHFGSATTDPENMLKILDRFGRFGKPIRITELDVNMLDPELRANFLRDVLIVCFSHPSVDGILQWGFWEGKHWQPDAAVYTRNWDLRRHGQAWHQQMRQWTTDCTVLTASDGTATVRGFIGEYSIDCRGVTRKVVLPAEGAEIVLSAE